MNEMTQLDPIVNLPSLYINGGVVSNDATTPHTILDIAAGQFRDSNNMIDMVLGDFLNEGYGTDNSVTRLNAAVNGINGLDTGSLATSSIYAIYVIGDSSNKNPTGVIASLASNSVPLLPFGYDSYRKIAYWPTQSGSAYWAVGYYTPSSIGVRRFYYDAPIALTLASSGAATTYSAGATALTNIVPAVNNLPIFFNASFIPGNAAGDTLKMQPGNGTGDAIIVTGQVTTVHVTQSVTVLSQLVSGVPTVNYKVTNSGDTAALNVAGFEIAL
jgi:hypothetical protein